MEALVLVQTVRRLKDRLCHSQDAYKISKTLRRLQELNISLDVLVETGIGKTVNGFRKHPEMGEVAKSIVNQWKKLVPEGKDHDLKPKVKHDKDAAKGKSSHSVSRKSTVCQEKALDSAAKKTKNQEIGNTFDGIICKKEQPKEKRCERNNGNKEHNVVNSKLNSQSNSNSEKDRHEKSNSSLSNSKKTSLKRKHDKNSQPSKDENLKAQYQGSKTINTHSDDEYDVPTMSFESYLNYDQVSIKRKKRSCLTNEPSRKIQMCKQYCNLELCKNEKAPAIPKSNNIYANMEENESRIKEGKTVSLSDLLNVPLPKFLPEYSILPSPPQTTDSKVKLLESLNEQKCESSGFTGRRLNSKMLVYSGSKIIYLPKMLTLYEQCIRILQNNIDAIQEVGGVPYEILKPVLERCTPIQLIRIEEFNPDSGDLWEKHCAKDFKSHKLLEYETWRELYLRVLSEREEKLKLITQNISSAHSGKQQGRQVKLAFINSTAKPPRNIRRRQEINGTAGPIVQPHPIDKLKQQKSENKERVDFALQPTKQTSSTDINNHTGGPNQDPRKTVKRIAPMMAKSMRAFKNRVGPR
ncbi:hypothetical protein GDO86_009902 [Hymenochirus boettgeri]|uniref:TFIIS N-terminal domain-containing protein n=1 Tax=Hymenochirus boettgeri TaxID=247094 RepID=A0A8T2JNK7_9PIPI|nr:hypothetical protein GDO86_009902 [Hymenochirus boettgeri]